MDSKTLLQYEPKLAKLFINSRKRNRLSNAYILYGQRNAPLKEIAIYLAQSLSCKKEALACNDCDDCLRFRKGIRPDFHLIEGDRATIKKEQVKALEEAFSLSALEKGHTLTYVIHQADNITEEAANALLKFLEEPREGQIAFLTTTNITRVLPTIRSRSIAIRVDPIEPKAFFDSLSSSPLCDAKGQEYDISLPSLFLLSRLFPSREEILSALAEDETILPALSSVECFLSDFSRSALAGMSSLLLSCHQIREGKCYNWMYLALDELFGEVLSGAYDEQNPFHDVLSALEEKKAAIRRGKEIVRRALSLRQINLSPTCQMAKLLQRLSEDN